MWNWVLSQRIVVLLWSKCTVDSIFTHLIFAHIWTYVHVHIWAYMCPCMSIYSCVAFYTLIRTHIALIVLNYSLYWGKAANVNAGGEIIGFAGAQRLRLNFYHSFEFQNQTETLDICNIIIGKSSHFLWWPLVTSLSALWGKFQINIGFFTF